ARTRRYHALLLAATTPPTGRYTLVNGCDCWIERQGRRFPLSTQCYTPGVTSPDGERRLETFSPTPWPSWLFRLEDDTEVEQQLFVPRGSARVILSWRLRTPAPGVRLVVRPFLSGRDYHALQDRKSTRLNSSHVSISYAVFCLKKKKTRCTSSPALT